jgi:hypothetical protein
MLFYVETGIGCSIEYGRKGSENKVRERVLREVGTYNGVKRIREATKDDIAWVQAMGGYIPKGRNL